MPKHSTLTLPSCSSPAVRPPMRLRPNPYTGGRAPTERVGLRGRRGAGEAVGREENPRQCDGVVLGFLDADHLLIGHYHYKGPGNAFDYGTIVGLDGAVPQASTLPGIRRLTRVGTGEILAEVGPDGHAVVFDPFTGDALWAAPPAAQAAIAGPDHVAASDAAGVQLVKWR